MTKDEKILEILNSKPSQKIGLDDFYGKQTVINMLKEAINYTSCCTGEAEQLLCSCDNPDGFKEMEEGIETCSKCTKPY